MIISCTLLALFQRFPCKKLAKLADITKNEAESFVLHFSCTVSLKSELRWWVMLQATVSWGFTCSWWIVMIWHVFLTYLPNHDPCLCQQVWANQQNNVHMVFCLTWAFLLGSSLLFLFLRLSPLKWIKKGPISITHHWRCKMIFLLVCLCVFI